MGHRRLGQLPATRNWRKVVDMLTIATDPAAMADTTSRAADRGLELAKNDEGIARIVFALMETVWSAKGEGFREGLTNLGMQLPETASLLDVVGAFDDAVDRSLRRAGHRTDLAEMAKLAAVEALTSICRNETGSLFGVVFEDTQKALKKYATPDRFAEVGQDFFGKFLFRFLDYHLSRELPNHIGRGKGFRSINDAENFKNALALHCHQTTRIVKEFAGCWPSAAQYREGITMENVRTKFIPVAFNKIRSELKQRSGANA